VVLVTDPSVVFLVFASSTTPNPKTPLMSIYLKEPLNKSPETAKIIRDKLHATHVKDLVQSVSLVYDSADFTSESAEDARIVRLYEAFGVNTITPQEAPGCSDFSSTG
jgi:DNA-directed RNA polymerase beta' subunit